MSEPREIRTKIRTQGAVIANPGGIVYRESSDIAVVCVDLQTKYARMGGTGSGGGSPPMVFLHATEDSLHLKKGKARDDFTVIEFPDFIGWTPYIAEVSRYTLSICFLKDEEEHG